MQSSELCLLPRLVRETIRIVRVILRGAFDLLHSTRAVGRAAGLVIRGIIRRVRQSHAEVWTRSDTRQTIRIVRVILRCAVDIRT
eukprot:1624703-Pyramimonas_sp.AAC.1